MHVRCPHCHNPMELVDDASLTDVRCLSCDSSFSLVSGNSETVSRPREDKMIAQFRLVQRIGAGAFGEVWRANDSQLDRTVAVKIPRKDQLSPEESELFLREAQLARSRGDVDEERANYFKVLALLRDEKIDPDKGLTGTRLAPREGSTLKSDEDLQKQISIILRSLP